MQNILRLPQVKTRTGLSRSTVYLKLSQGNFPKPVPLGPRAIGWLESEIDEWIERRIAERSSMIKRPAIGKRWGVKREEKA